MLVFNVYISLGMGSPIIAHSVIEELALYLIMEESRFLMESMVFDEEQDDIGD